MQVFERRNWWRCIVGLSLAVLVGGAPTAAAQSSPRVAFLLPGSVADKGYNFDGQHTADVLRDQLGADVTTTENVSVPNQTDAYRQYASQGYDLVIGWGGQFTDGAMAAGDEFPDTKFLVVNSTASNGTNVASMDTDVEQWQFVAGYLVARLSKSGAVGWIGGQCFPATAANLHGTQQGALYANPNAKFLSSFTGDFEDPTKAQQAAQAMFDQGADGLVGNLNNGYFGMFRAADGAGAIVITEWADNSELDPKVIASSVLKGQSRFVLDIAEKLVNGTFEGTHYQYSLPPDLGPAISKTNLVPDAVYQDALGVQAKIASGEVKVQRDESCPNQ
jgi:basic membrane protein A and related proteins